ncbi:DUF1911 domain-containing protein [Pseudomonas fulva]|nr:DUF1911 domain-containing protein [Pseudomonas fulva]MBF8719807.1 DUF1911 domain-containing protein [Pseudomonas fulva]MBF8786014.1 DUF1911 domain-containing protein [Pseudomonas fulva]
MQALHPIDWKYWATWQVPSTRFEQRREPHLRYFRYSELFEEALSGVAMITTDLPKYRDKAKPGGLMTSTRQRLWDVLNWLSLQYSAGAPVEAFAEVWPHALVWAEEYAGFQEAYLQTPDANGRVMPHVYLKGNEYWIVALRLVCFGLLSGHAAQMPRVMAILDFANVELGIRDGLLERLVAPFAPGRGTPPDTATRHLPYRKLFKVFDATPEKRPTLMTKYLDEWYHASRREPYTDLHGESDVSFYGYWAWEAAAVTWLLEIDDSSYRDMPFYPRDLADFARNLPATPATPSVPPPTYAGQPCPRAGYWFTLAQHGSRRQFAQDEVFPEIPSETSKGLTLWQWADNQIGDHVP